MSTKKSPEQIAEERYNQPGVHSHDARLMVTFKRQGYAACYREHVLSRQSEEKPVAWMSKSGTSFVTNDAMEGGTVPRPLYPIRLYAHPATPPVTVDGIMEVVDILVKIKANIDHGVEQANILFNIMGRRLNGRDHEDGDVLKNDNAEMDLAIKKLNDMVSYLTPKS